LPVDALIRTGDVDHADWNYRPLLGWFQRLRFRCVLGLLEGRHFDRLLEVGYGSGVFMPALRRFCRDLYGVDVHDVANEIRQILRDHGVQADLRRCGVEQMPFPDAFFDCIVCVSALEFVEDVEMGCRELTRVMTPDGYLVVVTPRHSKLLDLGLRVLTGERADIDYAGRREAVLPTLLRYFRIDDQGVCDKPPGMFLSIYAGLRLRLKDVSG
jgi:ubiquinone/menaquinone biosynthesis C-methylase UbiE